MLKKLKSLFVVEDDSAPEESATKAKPAQQKAGKVDVNKIVKPKTTAQYQKQFDDVLIKALTKNDLEGYDYFEYRSSMESLAKMKMDESTRYQSAFAMAQTMGTTPQKLISSAEFYQQVLQKELKNFEETLAFQNNKQVNSKKELLVKYQKEVKLQEEQILKLNKNIEKLKTEMSKVKGDVEQSKSKINKTKESFELSYYNAVQKIQVDIDKMKQYLK